MSTEQQQQKPGIQPSLSELDTPSTEQKKSEEQPKTEEVEPNNDLDPNANPDPNKDKKPGEDTPNEEEEETEPDPIEFYNEVSKLRGDGFKWEFPQDVDPLTPAGMHHAISKIVDHELDVFEENLMKTDPRAYAYMLHRSRGGSDEDFFTQKTEVLPEWDALKNSVDLQQAFYTRALTRKGILPEQAELIIKDAIEKKKLEGLVQVEFNQTKKQQEDQLKELLRINEQETAREKQAIQKMGTTLQERIIENKGLDITIPDAKRAEFLQFVNSLVFFDRESGRWFVNQELTSENMNQVLQSLYYLNVKGNISEIISRKAKEENIKKVKFRMQSDKTKVSTQQDPNNKGTSKPGVHLPLSEI